MYTEEMRQAQAVLDIIEQNPKSHDQRWWGNYNNRDLIENECHTTQCIAGHLALMNEDAQYVDRNLRLNSDFVADGSFSSSLDEGNWIRYGKNKLGLSDQDAELLFMQTNNDQAHEALKYLAKGETIPWDIVGLTRMDML